MRINEFIEAVSKENSMKRIGSIIETKKYLPIAEKRRIAESVIDACSVNDNGFIQVDSLDKYIMFTIVVIKEYTNLEFGLDGDYLVDYDQLCEAGLLDAVIETFAQEYVRTNEILNMMLSDKLQQNSAEASLAFLASRVSGLIDKLARALSDKIDTMNLDLGNLNQDTINRILNLMNTSK
jgi:hypothetical protein